MKFTRFLPWLGVAATLAVVPAQAGSAHRILAAGDLAALTSRLEPGDVAILPNAAWDKTRLTFRGKGTREKPITLRAETPGKFVLTGKSHLIIEGEWLVVEGVTLKDGGPDGTGIEIRGENNRLTGSVVEGGTYKFFVVVKGRHNRVDHCYLAGKTSEGPSLVVDVDPQAPNYHRIERNHFGHRPPLGRNGGETIRVGFSGTSLSNSRTTVQQNLFERCDGEIEIISNKSCENTYRANTFRESDGMLTLRHGNRCVVDGNFFLGRGKRGSGGVRVIGEDHVIINNYIEGVTGGGFWLTSGVPDSQLHQYFQVKRATIAFNTIVASAGPYLDLSNGHTTSGRSLLPEAVTVADNLFVVGEGGILLRGTEGNGWRWAANVAHGGGDAPPRPGVRIADPAMRRAPDGLLRPGNQATVRGQADSTATTAALHDMDGQRRVAPPDVGADQASDRRVDHRPLTAAEVGPAWLKR